MKLKLQFASLVTLGLLSGFVFAIILAAVYLADMVSWPLVIILVILFNVIIWLLGPYISDLMYKWFYKIEFYEYEQIKDRAPMAFLKRVCDEHNIKVPRIGIIRDKNPTAFTYGSAAFNARIVFTEGLFDFLNEKELEAVAAHELGHIVNKDFIIMAIAATLLQLLYEMFVIFTRARSGGRASISFGKRGEKKGGEGVLVAIGLVSYFFYWLGTYIVLFLSRTREYYADEFSAKATGDPNMLSLALIKIAYGIAAVPDTEKTAHLLNNTRAQGIFDFKTAKETALVYQNTKTDHNLLERAFLFDLVNPWAFFYELKSTHPLVGKRIRRLCTLTESPAFRFEDILRKTVDKSRVWKNFFTDLLVMQSTTLLTIGFLVAMVVTALAAVAAGGTSMAPILGVVMAYLFLFFLLSVIKVNYRYPTTRGFAETTVLECMADVYASPVRGKPVKLEGKSIGRGQAGYIFGEDMMFRDKSGIIYLNYESGIPLIGNLIFAWKRLEEILNRQATASGWFLRGVTHHLELHRYNAEGTTIKSYVRLWYMLSTMILPLILVIIAAVVMV